VYSQYDSKKRATRQTAVFILLIIKAYCVCGNVDFLIFETG